MDQTDQHELKDTPLYILADFPVITPNHNIDWETSVDTPLTERLEKGVVITEENAELFQNEFNELKKRYGFKHAEIGWIEKDNGLYSLKRINVNAGNGLWMHVFSGIGDHEGTPMEAELTPSSRLEYHNIDSSYQALFLVESLAHYFKHADITFPFIRSETDPSTNSLVYSFEIPYDERFDYVKSLPIYCYNCKFPIQEISKTRIAINEDCVAYLSTNENNEKVWIAKELTSANDAVQLFHLLAVLLKREL